MSSIDYSVQDLLIRPADHEETSADMKIIARTARLSGHFSVMLGEVRPGEILGFHSHQNEDQHMYIIDGELHFEVGGAGGLRFTAGAGDNVLKPRSSSHGFWNLTDKTVHYIETSTQDGFETFVDSRSDGLMAMLGGATEELGMSFETDRTLEVMKEFGLTGIAGANANPEELIRDPQFHEAMRTNETLREMVFYLGGAALKDKFQGLIGKLPPLPGRGR
ncbi:hypothetical protein PPSIR1_04043 [Plesiocystis pacifica SIR-1]|uniref:Cupin type-2 domain-containing protein n=1 Tax=Plesiocystis pacifica SIR-1 TaxID=391625 RepID=A6G4G7_9BACT|nr:cupin domain-containing protein [Plesiocystis pacifica]EDM79279.1 hypothetical protein PPSIR1_04043 [Plesiocystis pacifica SIR-1]